jgi:hypothetical protein
VYAATVEGGQGEPFFLFAGVVAANDPLDEERCQRKKANVVSEVTASGPGACVNRRRGSAL